MATTRTAPARQGFAAGIGANLLWGFLPLVFQLVETVDPVSVIANRAVWTFLIVGGIVVMEGWQSEVRKAFVSRPVLRRLAVSSAVLTVNWLIYVWAVETDQVLEASFGYFINPMVNVLMGMVLLGEHQTPRQAVALAIAAVAIVIQALGIGGVPLVSLGLAASFALYGYFRKTVAASSAIGLFVETTVLLPFAILFIAATIWLHGPGPYGDPRMVGLLMLTGPATAVPLLLFAFAVRRLRLTTIGMLQYVAPSIQFLLAITWFHEPLSAVRLVSFVLIWVSLVVFSLEPRAKAAPISH